MEKRCSRAVRHIRAALFAMTPFFALPIFANVAQAVEYLGGQTIDLRSSNGGNFLSARIDQGGNLLSVAPSVQDWEKFDVVDYGGGWFALKSHANGKFVTANLNLANAPLQAVASTAQQWEMFQIVDAGGGNIALKSQANNLYVSTRSDAGMAVRAQAGSIQGWETYHYDKISSSSSSTSGGLSTSKPPGGNFNLSGFTLQLPTGSSGNVDTISGSQLAGGFTKSPYFYTDSADGAMVMADPATGWTTSGSLHPRVELRENAIWPTSGTNVMTNTVAVTKVPSHTTIGQIFQGTGPSKPLCELQVTSSGVVQLLLESTNQGGSSTMNTIASVGLGTKFTYSLQLSGKTITVKVGSTTKTFTMPSSFVGESFYFKAGDYDQSAVSGTPSSTASTIVKFYALSISH